MPVFIFCQNLGIYLAGTFLSNWVVLRSPSHWEDSRGVIGLGCCQTCSFKLLVWRNILSKKSLKEHHTKRGYLENHLHTRWAIVVILWVAGQFCLLWEETRLQLGPRVTQQPQLTSFPSCRLRSIQPWTRRCWSGWCGTSMLWCIHQGSKAQLLCKHVLVRRQWGHPRD